MLDISRLVDYVRIHTTKLIFKEHVWGGRSRVFLDPCNVQHIPGPWKTPTSYWFPRQYRLTAANLDNYILSVIVVAGMTEQRGFPGHVANVDPHHGSAARWPIQSTTSLRSIPSHPATRCLFCRYNQHTSSPGKISFKAMTAFSRKFEACPT